MKAVIIAGGQGTRMKNYNLPKALLNIGKRTLIEWQLEQLKKTGIKEVVICTGHMGEMIKSRLGNHKDGFLINYSHEETPLGTGGALKHAEKLINDSFLLIYGDIVFGLDLRKIIEFHKKKNAAITVLVHRTTHPEDSDLVVLDDNGKIKALHRKPHKNPVNSDISKSSIYVVEKSVIELMPDGIYDFVDFVEKTANKGNVYGYMTDDFVTDVGTPERYEKVKKLVADNDNL